MKIRKLFTCDDCGIEWIDEHESTCHCCGPLGTWTESQVAELPVNIDFSNPIFQVKDQVDSDCWRTINDEGYEQYTKDGVPTRVVYAELRIE